MNPVIEELLSDLKKKVHTTSTEKINSYYAKKNIEPSTGLRYFAMVFPVSKIFGMSTDEAMCVFQDPAYCSGYIEKYAAKLYQFTEHFSRSYPKTDGLLGSKKISIRQLTRAGVNFNHSRNKGSKRSSDKSDLGLAILDNDISIVVDIVNFPNVYFNPVDHAVLTGCFRKGNVKQKNSRAAFYRYLVDEDVVYHKVDVKNNDLIVTDSVFHVGYPCFAKRSLVN